jgi:hypothetical protein
MPSKRPVLAEKKELSRAAIVNWLWFSVFGWFGIGIIGCLAASIASYPANIVQDHLFIPDLPPSWSS